MEKDEVIPFLRGAAVISLSAIILILGIGAGIAAAGLVARLALGLPA